MFCILYLHRDQRTGQTSFPRNNDRWSIEPAERGIQGAKRDLDGRVSRLARRLTEGMIHLVGYDVCPESRPRCMYRVHICLSITAGVARTSRFEVLAPQSGSEAVLSSPDRWGT
jgi:hypothetical protein